MLMKRFLVSLLLASFLTPYAVKAQTPQTDAQTANSTTSDQQPSQEDLKKKALVLLDEIIKDIDDLRVPENRVHFKTAAADMLWDSNEQRARTLFKEAIAEFNQISSMAQSDDDSDSSVSIMPQGAATASLRREILFAMARHDARGARNFLRSTRQSSENSYAQGPDSEEYLEMNLAALISSQDPQQALEMAEDSLKKGYKPGLSNVLRTLAQRDHEAGAKLAEEIFNKLKNDNLATNREAFDFALGLLAQSAQPGVPTLRAVESQDGTAVYSAAASSQTSAQTAANSSAQAKAEPLFTKQQMHDLSEMLIAAAMSRRMNSSMTLITLGPVMSQLEEYAPERTAQLRARTNQAQRRTRRPSTNDSDDAQTSDADQGEASQMERYQQIIQRGNLSEIREALKTAEPGMRFYLLNTVIDKAVAQGQGEQVRQLINDSVTDTQQRNSLLARLNERLMSKATSEGRIEEARRILAAIRNPERRALALAQLSGTALAANNKKLAASLLDEARNLVNYRAKNFVQLGAQLEVARNYALVDTSKSLSMLEPIVDQLNELISAGSVIGGFISEDFVRDDEIVMIEPVGELAGMFSMQYTRELNALVTGDFARTKALADRFQRPEVRLLARTLIAASILAPQSMVQSRASFDLGPRY